MNREEAIDQLRTAGVGANARDWVLGKTIAIPIGDAEMVGEIRLWPSVAFLCPDGNAWTLVDPDEPDNPVARYETLEQAVSAMPEYARTRAEALKKRMR